MPPFDVFLPAYNRPSPPTSNAIAIMGASGVVFATIKRPVSLTAPSALDRRAASRQFRRSDVMRTASFLTFDPVPCHTNLIPRGCHGVLHSPVGKPEFRVTGVHVCSSVGG